jgi:catechol-2,3-dioxygenase
MHITQLELVAPDLDAQQKFYEETLGLPLTGTITGKRTFSVGTTQLSFTQPDSAPNGIHHFAINIPENQFDEARLWIMARTPLLIDANGRDTTPFPVWNAHSLYFKDPAGNILEFIARHALPNASQTVFGPSSFLCVSEIGLVTANVQKTVAALKNEFNIEPYTGPGSNDFAAVGDENGLFIVARQSRIWMPDSGIPATIKPFRVAINGGALIESERFLS